MSTITINYTANYLGDHRICYRKTGTLAYCCLLDTVTALGPQTFVIDFSVAPDFCFGLPEEVTPPVVSDCGPVEYDGYIQPICEIFGSLNNRTPFIASFTTVPTCLQYGVSCIETGIQDIIITIPGNLYTVIPAYVISGAGGATAQLHMFVQSGAATIVGGGPGSGAGYTAADVLTVVGGVGTATQIQVTSVDGGGGITGYSVIVAGDYTVLPVNAVATIGGTGVGATFNLTYGVLSITMTAPGTYTIATPIITIDPPGGFGVTAIGVVVMFPCLNVISPPTCGVLLDNGIPNPGLTLALDYLTSAVFCTTAGTPVFSPDYSVGVDPFNLTCCGCELLTASVVKGTIAAFWYTDAITHNFIYSDNGGAGFVGPTTIVSNVNAIPNSWGYPGAALGGVDIVTIACP